MCYCWNEFLNNNPELSSIITRVEFCKRCPADLFKINPPPPEWLRCKVVNCSKVNVRQFPWTGKEVPPAKRVLNKGDGVIVYSVAGVWAMISRDGNEWVGLKFLEPLPPADK